MCTRSSLALFITLVTAGCGAATNGPGEIRFHNAPVVWRVADGDPIERPESTQVLRRYYHFNQITYRDADHELGVPDGRRAQNVNALGGVPSSSWFERRISKKALDPAAVQRGPVRQLPDTSEPLEIVSGKIGGTAVGFIAKDKRGDMYLLKFDSIADPVADTAAHIVVNRLLWAIGYLVPEDSIIRLSPGDFRIGEGATYRGGFTQEKLPITKDYLREVLQRLPRDQNGKLRVLASRFLPGKPIGGFAQEGTRPDDPNDRIPHEHRRELRGMYVFFSWLKSTDMKTDNSLDMWLERKNGRGLVRHYLLDFGKSLGANGLTVHIRGDGHERHFEWSYLFSRMFTFGLLTEEWERLPAPGQPHVGILEVDEYRPDEFKTRSRYMPWENRDRFDTFWAASILARFEEAHIRAAVAAAEYPDPRSGDYIVQALMGRRRVALRHWFSKVTPIDEFEVDSKGHLCFLDLGAKTGVLAAPVYRTATFDFDGHSLAAPKPARRRGFRYCSDDLALGVKEAAYTIVTISGEHAGKVLPPVDVHLARANGARMRVIGVWRH